MKSVMSEMSDELRPRDGVPAPARAANPSKIVLLWATIGVVLMGIGLQAQIRWIASDEFHPTDPGNDPFTGSPLYAIRTLEVVSLLIGAYMLWRFLLRPLIRDRTFTFDGMLLVSGFFLWWIDALGNYFIPTTSYNAHLWNYGSWTCFVPGWQNPTAPCRFPEPIAFDGGAYIWWILGSILAGCWLLRRMSAKWPNMSMLTMLSAIWVTFFFLDIVVEFIFIRIFQLWVYPGAPHALTLFAGNWYQLPLQEPIAVATFSTPFVALRYFRDDRGRSFAERGIDSLRVSQRAKKFITFFAISGVLQGCLLFGYYVPFTFFGLHADTAPALPSYFRAGYGCGVGTDYACPSNGDVPIPAGPSLHIRPDDPRLPQSVRDQQGWPPPGKG